METVSCRNSTSSPSSDKSQESPLFHNYSDLKSSPGTLVYFPSWFRLWDSVSTQHLARESWRAISSFKIWTLSGGWGLRSTEPDFTQPRAISSCSNNQHPPRLIPCQGHQDCWEFKLNYLSFISYWSRKVTRLLSQGLITFFTYFSLVICGLVL